MKKHITQEELLLAIAMSEFYQTTHVMFLPPNTEYIHMLHAVKNKKLVTNMAQNFYKLTEKGWRKIRARYNESMKEPRMQQADKAIEEFLNSL